MSGGSLDWSNFGTIIVWMCIVLLSALYMYNTMRGLSVSYNPYRLVEEGIKV